MAKNKYEEYKEQGLSDQIIMAIILQEEADKRIARINAEIDASLVCMMGPELGEKYLDIVRPTKKRKEIEDLLYEEYLDYYKSNK